MSKIYGEKLNDDIIDFANNVSNKRKQFFTLALKKHLENITYQNLKILTEEDLDGFSYEPDSDTDK